MRPPIKSTTYTYLALGRKVVCPQYVRDRDAGREDSKSLNRPAPKIVQHCVEVALVVALPIEGGMLLAIVLSFVHSLYADPSTLLR